MNSESKTRLTDEEVKEMNIRLFKKEEYGELEKEYEHIYPLFNTEAWLKSLLARRNRNGGKFSKADGAYVNGAYLILKDFTRRAKEVGFQYSEEFDIILESCDQI